jgi:glycosyltransferase involved in cell wall biosynthesis
MTPKTIVISINAAWNIYNFRMGLIRGLRAAGHRVIALAPPDDYAERLRAEGLEFVPIEIDKKGISPTRDLALLIRYWRRLGRLKADLFLGYTAKPNIYGSIAARLRRARVINNVSGLGTAFIRRSPLTIVVSLLYRFAFRGSSTVFFQNAEDRDLFLEKRLVRAAQARLLPGSGVDLHRFAVRPLPASPADAPVFLLVARLLRDKGVVEFVEAAREVKKAFPAAQFRILGFLDVENRTAISRGEVEEWAREGVVEYLGAADDVRPHIEAADCVVLPSYREGLPRSLLEAAAVGRPLIATDVPGCRHIVTDGENGLLCAARDAGSLARAMLRMIEAGQEQRKRWAAAGRARVEREFDERLAVRLYLEAIEAACEN